MQGQWPRGGRQRRCRREAENQSQKEKPEELYLRSLYHSSVAKGETVPPVDV